MFRRFGSTIRDQWMGALALFLFAVSGTAYAANTVFSGDIVDGEVKSADLANAAVTNAKLADNSVGKPKISAGAVENGKIADGAVGTSKLGPGAATNAKIADGAVNSAKVQNNTLTGTDVFDESLTTFDVLDGSLGGNDIVEEGIDSSDIEDNSLTGDDINESSLDAIPAEDYHVVAPNPPGEPGVDPCDVAGLTETFCGFPPTSHWLNYGNGYTPARFYKDAAGIVHIEGLVRGNITGTIFILPPGYRPSGGTLVFSVDCHNEEAAVPTDIAGRVDVHEDGSVDWPGGNADNCQAAFTDHPGYISLTGIHFRTG